MDAVRLRKMIRMPKYLSIFSVRIGRHLQVHRVYETQNPKAFQATSALSSVFAFYETTKINQSKV